METLDALLRSGMEPLQYAAFFGALAVLGVLEAVVARSPAPPQRRRRWFPNFALTSLNIMVIGAIPVSGVAAADYASSAGVGLLNVVATPLAVSVCVGFLLRSLIAWGTHLAMHKIPILWRVHRVHHTDSVLDVSTTVRFHPLEFLIATPVLLTGILLTGIPPVALMAYEILDAAMAVFTHANVRIPASTDRWLRYVLVTPDMHRIHHSTRRPETDSNYGATLSLWDHLFRTHRAKAPQELASQTLGLDGVPPSRETSLGWLLLLPWRRDAT